MHSLKKGGTAVDLPYVTVLLKACWGLLEGDEAREGAKAAGGEAALEELKDWEGEEGWMVACLLKRLRGENLETKVEDKKQREVDTVEEDVVLGFQKLIEGEEKIHSAIENVEGDEVRVCESDKALRISPF